MEVDIFSTKKKYGVIYADPPWRYGDRNCNGACEKHYNTMTLQEIKNLPVWGVAEKDCVLFLWTTYPMLREALEVIDAWGFKYKSIAFQWIKLNRSGKGKFFGLGRWTRGNTEPCLLAVKGKPHRKNNSVSQLIEYPLGPHSAKPPITREKIKELMGTDTTCLELFARSTAEGWDCWGNEVGKLDHEEVPEQPQKTDETQISIFDFIQDMGGTAEGDSRGTKTAEGKGPAL